MRSLRAHVEGAAKTALARELAAGARCDERLAQARSDLASAVESAPEAVPSGTSDELQARQAYLERRASQAREAAAVAAHQRRQVEARRAELERAAAEAAAVERLRERQRAAHAAEESRSETDRLGEIAVFRAGRTERLL